MNSSSPPTPDTPAPKFPVTEEQIADVLGAEGTTLTVDIMRMALERLRADSRLPQHNHPIPPFHPSMHLVCPVCTRTIC